MTDTPTSGHDPVLPADRPTMRSPSDKTLADLAGDAVDLGGLLDGAWVLVDDDTRQARNAMLPILEAAKRMADELANELEARDKAQREEGQ